MSDLNIELLLASQREQRPTGVVQKGSPPVLAWGTPEELVARTRLWAKAQEDAEALVAAGLAEWRQVPNRYRHILGEAEYFEVLRPTRAGTKRLVREDLYDPSAPYIIGEVDVSGYALGGGRMILRRYDGQGAHGPQTLYAWNDGVITWTKERD